MTKFKTTVIAAVIFAIGVVSVACSRVGQEIENVSMNNLEQQAEPSDVAIRELFVESGLGDGDEYLEELKKISSERVIAIVREIREKGIREGDTNYGIESADENLRMKAAYFLAVLGDDVDGNEAYLVNLSKSKQLSIRFEALGHLSVRVSDGRKQHLPILFAASRDSDGHLSEELTVLFSDEALNSTETFLRYLSKEAKPVRESVLKRVAEFGEPDLLERTRQNVAAVKDKPDLKSVASEFLAVTAQTKKSP